MIHRASCVAACLAAVLFAASQASAAFSVQVWTDGGGVIASSLGGPGPVDTGQSYNSTELVGTLSHTMPTLTAHSEPPDSSGLGHAEADATTTVGRNSARINVHGWGSDPLGGNGSGSVHLRQRWTDRVTFHHATESTVMVRALMIITGSIPVATATGDGGYNALVQLGLTCTAASSYFNIYEELELPDVPGNFNDELTFPRVFTTVFQARTNTPLALIGGATYQIGALAGSTGDGGNAELTVDMSSTQTAVFEPLTEGVTITSDSGVDYVPEPAMLGLLGIGVLAVVRRRR